MFVTKWRCIDFVTIFCQYQVSLKCRKLIYQCFPQMKRSPQIKKRVTLTSDFLCLQKMKKDTLFYHFALTATRRKRVYTFLSILLSLKKVDKHAQKKHPREKQR